MNKIALVLGLLSLAVSLAPMAAHGAEATRDKVFGEENSEKALVYVIRGSAQAGSARTAFVYSNEEFFGVVENSSYTFGYLEPGEHTLFVAYHGTAGTGRFNRPDKVAKMKQRGQTLQLEAGETYFLRASGFRLEEPLDRAKAEKMIKRSDFYVVPDDKEKNRSAEALAELGSEPEDR